MQFEAFATGACGSCPQSYAWRCP